jgi:hypothetical protein
MTYIDLESRSRSTNSFSENQHGPRSITAKLCCNPLSSFSSIMLTSFIKLGCSCGQRLNDCEHIQPTHYMCELINSPKKNIAPYHRGVPQGSIMGPILFTAYTSSFGIAILRDVTGQGNKAQSTGSQIQDTTTLLHKSQISACPKLNG